MSALSFPLQIFLLLWSLYFLFELFLLYLWQQATIHFTLLATDTELHSKVGSIEEVSIWTTRILLGLLRVEGLDFRPGKQLLDKTLLTTKPI